MAFVFCFSPSSLELMDYLKLAGYIATRIAMLPKPVFMPSGGLFHLCSRYWPQSTLFIILMRFIDGLFICSIYGTMSSDSLRPGLGLPDWHWPLLIRLLNTEGWFHLGSRNSEPRSLWLIRLMNVIAKPASNGPRKKKKPSHPDLKSKLTLCFRPNTLIFVFQISEPQPFFLSLGKTHSSDLSGENVSGTLKGQEFCNLIDVLVKMEIMQGSYSFHMPFSRTFQGQN